MFSIIKFIKFKMIGSSSCINLYPSLTPMLGLVLGPIYGSLVIIILFIYYCIFHPKALYFGIFSIVPPILSVIVASYLSEGKWKIPAIIFGVGLLIFYFTDVGKIVWYHPIFSIISFLLILTLKDEISKNLFSKNTPKFLVSVLVFCFITVMTDHLYGSILGIIYLHLPPDMYKKAIHDYILERTIMTIIGSIFVIFNIEIMKFIISNYEGFKREIILKFVDIKSNEIEIDKELLKKYNIKLLDKEEKERIIVETLKILSGKK
ncbi:hypothetical protein ACPB8Q_03300 [Methanocaldococcus indicus]|uniref:hypothetical protein n=1 Tax=Methanocaldococcus indicus TaxID=213231 RepID=UPI003C6D1755